MEFDGPNPMLLKPDKQRAHHLPSEALPAVLGIGIHPLNVSCAAARVEGSRQSLGNRPRCRCDKTAGFERVINNEGSQVSTETIADVELTVVGPRVVGQVSAH
jgi:hypothetical protein